MWPVIIGELTTQRIVRERCTLDGGPTEAILCYHHKVYDVDWDTGELTRQVDGWCDCQAVADELSIPCLLQA